MKQQLFWKICAVLVVGVLLLFWCINLITHQTEQAMSFISLENQQVLKGYGDTAEQLYTRGQTEALEQWLLHIQQTEQTWAALISSEPVLEAGEAISPEFSESHRLGRNIEWKIHLYFEENPIMDIPFADGKTHFLIKLPARMRPGVWYPYAEIALQVGIPLLLLSALALLSYGYLMSPLKRLQRATRAFSQGELDARTEPDSGFIGRRNDEITELGETFNDMAARTSSLIRYQREMLSDLSHELRTPLARMGLALTYMERGDTAQLTRLRHDLNSMGELVEATLTLAWFDTERPNLQHEQVDLAALLEVIVQDAQFEYPDRKVRYTIPNECWLSRSDQRALSHALENIIRNALKHTPADSQVSVVLQDESKEAKLIISDQGPGIPADLHEAIFRPFFQVDSARTEPTDRPKKGFGLGLALAKRQIEAVGGTITLCNRKQDGLVKGLDMVVTLPK